MKRLTISLMTILLLALLTSPAWSSDPVDITNPQKVAALTDLQKKIDSISTAVSACMNAGKKHGDCMCENKKLILSFNKTAEALFVTFPDLNAKDIVNFKTPKGEWVGQSLSGIKKQAQTKLSCS